ncbi:DUF1178 family protein [Rhizobiaceae bacterium BDR2-2]|uniref:DUF1178 family protein n=1 Tax=Ectorhizobium quercum TaxID=2965071 RepID=A0AAE3N2R3_9HYPH|nr:DUF1178 family protein [Ectorhizobium quercum]MCX8999978.1 DUF1178 family protein [Ectorhizobium quercum]
MIRYALICESGHDFEGWFSGSADFDGQMQRGLVSCPVCGSLSVTKALMAPSVAPARKKEQRQTLAMDVARKEAMAKLKAAIAEVKASSEDVGERFPEEARRIHYGEAETRGIIGQASVEEARDLIEEGIAVAPLPVFPDDVN